jgi:hypothetical protein
VLEDAERCALCRTPPVEHPYRPDLGVRSDRELWTWIARYRPGLFAQLCEAIAVAGGSKPVTFGDWRSRIPAHVREAVVGGLDDAELRADLLVPAARLAGLIGALTARELDFAVKRLLLPVCRACNAGRWRRPESRDGYLRGYVHAFFDGDEGRARADATAWRMMETVATRAAQLAPASEARPA